MDRDGEQLTMYSDYVCPFCYLGRLSLDQYRASRNGDLLIDWHPYDLRRQKRGPDGEIDRSIDDGKDEEYFAQVQDSVDRLREEYDANEMLAFDVVPDVDSFNAQLASWYVKQEYPSQWEGFDEAVFEALWVEGRDIGAVAVLRSLAEDVGLPAEEIQEAIADEDLRDELETRFRQAHQHGVGAVPTFSTGEHVARGAVPPEQLERLIEA